MFVVTVYSYGMKGAAIIEASLMKIVGVNNPPGSTIAPLSLARFTRYFLIPFVASRLISVDLRCNLKLAYEIMCSSSETGAILQPEDDVDEELEEILRSINKGCTGSVRHNVAAQNNNHLSQASQVRPTDKQPPDPQAATPVIPPCCPSATDKQLPVGGSAIPVIPPRCTSARQRQAPSGHQKPSARAVHK